MNKFIDFLSNYVFWYTFVMSLFWIAGCIVFIRKREHPIDLEIDKTDWPMISILIPCYNEEDTIEETIYYMDKIAYKNKEIIAVNDGSKDKTGEILHRLEKQYDSLKVIDCRENRGKATALKLATFASKTEYLVCVDSDAILDPYAAHYLIYHFLHRGERLGAVTGNPRIRNRDTLLAKLQIVEYASIIGIIKRAQRIWGKVMTVSGVCVAFRKKALVDVGLWDHDMITEDISVSWKLQEKFWDIRYEPRALCWMLVPETLKGIWGQRIRWAQGGQEVIFRHWRIILDWRHRRLWPIYYEQWASLFWNFSWIIVTVYYLITAKNIMEVLIWFTFSSFCLVFLCLIQLIISCIIDSKYDNISPYLLWGAWYPFIYWILNTLIVMFALPKAIKSRVKGGYATWSSPDRGTRKSN
jgi:poly-beta-1,6-N-acetyl-D-glucosamine synthase